MAESYPSVCSGKFFTDKHNVIEELYRPCLQWCNHYVRDAGYFNSNVYKLMGSEIIDFIKRDKNNSMTIITSLHIKAEDYDAFKSIPETEVSEKSRDLAIQQLAEMVESDNEISEPTKLLAALSKTGQLSVLISLRNQTRNNPHAHSHTKTGYFSKGKIIVAFDGSINETYPALNPVLEEGNREHWNTYVSWESENYKKYAEPISSRLNREKKGSFPKQPFPGTIIVDIGKLGPEHFPSMGDDEWEIEYHRGAAEARSKIAYEEFEKLITIQDEKIIPHDKGAESRKLKIEQDDDLTLPSILIQNRPHQVSALNEWKAFGKKGILQHATGSGKTITSMAAMEEHLNSGGFVVLVVPNTVLQDQWYDELQCLGVHVNRLGGKKNRLSDKMEILEEIRQNAYSTPSVLLFVKNTFVQDEVVEAFASTNSQTRSRIMLVIDECHRAGEPGFAKYIKKDVEFINCLGLSATPFDPPEEEWIRKMEGENQKSPSSAEQRNEQIINIVGDVVDTFDLADAIKATYLTPYNYHIHETEMSEREQKEYDQFRIAFLRSKNKESNPLIHQARRVVKATDAKLQKAADIIVENYQDGQAWLVYCATNDFLESLIENLEVRDFSRWLQFTSWNSDSRDIHLKQFKEKGGVLLTVKCLDEGFNIPRITHGLVLASSTKEREFIQRRGRMLRKIKGKNRAEIHDIVSLPSDCATKSSMESILRHEIARVADFAETAGNKEIATVMVNKLHRGIARKIRYAE